MAASSDRLLLGIWRANARPRIVRVVVQDLARAAFWRRCAICGTRLLNGDPVSFCGIRPAHAECAVIHWLVRGRGRPSGQGEEGPVGDELRRELELLGLGDRRDIPA